MTFLLVLALSACGFGDAMVTPQLSKEPRLSEAARPAPGPMAQLIGTWVLDDVTHGDLATLGHALQGGSAADGSADAVAAGAWLADHRDAPRAAAVKAALDAASSVTMTLAPGTLSLQRGETVTTRAWRLAQAVDDGSLRLDLGEETAPERVTVTWDGPDRMQLGRTGDPTTASWWRRAEAR